MSLKNFFKRLFAGNKDDKSRKNNGEKDNTIMYMSFDNKEDLIIFLKKDYFGKGMAAAMQIPDRSYADTVWEQLKAGIMNTIMLTISKIQEKQRDLERRMAQYLSDGFSEMAARVEVEVNMLKKDIEEITEMLNENLQDHEGSLKFAYYSFHNGFKRGKLLKLFGDENAGESPDNPDNEDDSDKNDNAANNRDNDGDIDFVSPLV